MEEIEKTKKRGGIKGIKGKIKKRKEKKERKQRSRGFLFQIVSVVFLSLFLVIIFKSSFLTFAKDRYLELQTLTKVLNIIQKYYVKDVDIRKLIYGGIRGMLSELDPHTNFLPPYIYKEFEKETKGEFGGIGIEITIKNEVLTIISPVEDTPAWKAGLKAGDQIISIDGLPTKNLTLVETVQKMRGKRGSSVKLEILRQNFDKTKIFKITRGLVRIKSVKYIDLGEGEAYIRLTSFIQNSFQELKKWLKKHKKKYDAIEGLIIDMRKNPGGLFDQSVKISDMFLSGGKIVSVMGRDKKEEIFYAKKVDTYDSFPIVILIDEYSASASEIFAGALQDQGRALIMGQRSFGKGSVQSVVSLGDQSGLKLTVAQYYTPSGKSIQAEGIVPDVKIPEIDMKALTQAEIQRSVKREENIFGHLEKKNENKGKTNLDLEPQKKKKRKRRSSRLSKREAFLSSDFQVFQAFNYLQVLRKFKTLKGIEKSKIKKLQGIQERELKTPFE